MSHTHGQSHNFRLGASHNLRLGAAKIWSSPSPVRQREIKYNPELKILRLYICNLTFEAIVLYEV